MTRLGAPEAVGARDEATPRPRRARARERRAGGRSGAPRGGGRVALARAARVRRSRPDAVVERPRGAHALRARGGGGSSSSESGRAEVEPRAADDDRDSPPAEDPVDRRMREPLVLGHRALVVERPDPDEVRPLVLVREDRQAAVDLHRVGGDELGRDALGERGRDVALAARGRPEDRERPRTGTALRGDEGRLTAGERGRRGRVDLDRDELAGRGGPAEVHGGVPPRAPAQARGIRPARALDEHLLDEADRARGFARPRSAGRRRRAARAARASPARAPGPEASAASVP